MRTFAVGDQVVWRYEPRGGYGYQIPVNGIVEKVGPTRIRIKVARVDGTEVLRWVTADRLTRRAA